MARRREIRHQVLEALREHLAQPEDTPYVPPESHHAADLADVLWLDFQPEEARRLFGELPSEIAAEVLAEAEPPLVELLIEEMPPADLGELLGKVSHDDGTDILELVPEEERTQVLQHVPPQDAHELRQLGEYAADSAGGQMTTEFISVGAEENVGDLLKRLKRDEGEAETFSAFYVVDRKGRLEGVVSPREVLAAGIHEKVGDIMNPDVLKCRVDEDQEDVAHRILHYNLSAIPVVDADGAVVGIVTADDALEVLEEEGSEDALLLAGAGGQAVVSEPLAQKVMRRAPMLLVTVLAGIAMSRLMKYFAPEGSGAGGEASFFTIVAYIPLVLALAGTVGSQTSAVLVRGFAVGQIPHNRRFQALAGEVQVGVLLGLFCSVVTGCAGAIFAGSFTSGLALGFSLFLAISWTSVVASSIVIGSEATGFDPALVAGPVMMAVSDLSAVILFFGTFRLFLDAA